MHLTGLSYSFQIDNASFRVSMLSDGVIDTVIPGHSHAKDCYEIHYVTDGTGSVLLGDTRIPVEANTIYVTGPHIFHEQTPDLTHPMAEMCVYMQFLSSSEQFADAHVDHHLIQSFLQQTCWIGTDTTGILLIMKQLFSEAKTPSVIGHSAYMSGLFVQLFCALVRCYQTTSPSSSIATICSDFVRTNSVFKNSICVSYDTLSPLAIEEAFLNNYRTITLASLANATHLSVRQLQRLIQKQYGTTFQKKRTQARISAACILLKTTSYSLSEIADQTGYSSPEHFSYAFHQQMGCTPGVYRKQFSSTTFTVPEMPELLQETPH